MGTRNLTVVKSNDEIKVAQYGQWDGYPSGQGETVINFIENNDLNEFREKVNELEFLTEEDIKKLNVAGDVFDKHPYLSRDLGAQILHAIMHGEYKERDYNFSTGEENYITHEFEIYKLQNQIEFGCDSLMCEWAYVLDLDEMELVVYEGFQEEPHEEGIFVEYVDDPNESTATVSEYYCCKPIKSFDISSTDNIRERWDKWLKEYNKQKE